MKIILLLLIIIKTLLFSNYNLYYHDIKIGEINDINIDLEKHKTFLNGVITNPLAIFILGKNKIILYQNKEEKDNFDENNFILKYDKYKIITILSHLKENFKSQKLIIDDEGNKNYIEYICKDKICEFKYFDIIKNKITLNGLIEFDKFNELIKFTENSKNVKLINKRK